MAIMVKYDQLEKAKSDVNNVKAKFEDGMNTLENKVSEVTSKEIWQGPDATKFVETTNQKLTKVHSEYDEFLQQLSTAIQENYDKFQAVQQHNINTID